MNLHDHDRSLADAFDRQAAQFETAPVQSDPVARTRLVQFAALPTGGRVLDAGCGPGLVSETLLESDPTMRVFGIDLSPEMVARARIRCERFGDRAEFAVGSVFDAVRNAQPPFDAAISRYVIHHVADPVAFLRRQAELVRPGGVIVACDHTTDPEPSLAAWHQRIEIDRDSTHTRNLSPGALVDAFAQAGLEHIRLAEEPFTLDFDEWFGRGTGHVAREAVLAQLLDGTLARGFRPKTVADDRVSITCWRALVRGRRPE